MFEKWVGHKISNASIIGTNLYTKEPIQLEFPKIYETISFQFDKPKSDVLPFPTLYIPIFQTFPAWDMIIHDHSSSHNKHILYFIQTSINSFNVRDKGKTLNSLGL